MYVYMYKCVSVSVYVHLFIICISFFSPLFMHFYSLALLHPLRLYIIQTVKFLFASLVNDRGFVGKINIDRKQRTLDIIVSA